MEGQRSFPTKIELKDVHFERHPDWGGDELFHFSASVPGLKGKGFGTDHSEDLALKKAFNEMVERIYFHYRSNGNSRTSSGFAAHDSIEAAKSAALAEVYERHAFFTSWLLKSPPEWMDIQFDNGELHAFRAANCRVRVGRLANLFGHHCVVSVLEPNSTGEFGVVISSAANTDLKLAIRSTILELRRALQMIMVRKRTEEPIFKMIKECDIVNSIDHLEFYLNPVNSEKISWYFKDGVRRACENLPMPRISYEIFDTIQTPWPVKVVRASVDSLQQYYIGKTTSECLNFEMKNSMESLNWDLHPLP